MTRPVLLTNDDGYEAEGLLALWRAAREVFGGNVFVAAPRQCWSAKSHATTMHPREGIRIDDLEHAEMRGKVVSAYPADCVRVALCGLDLFAGETPLVLSGINPGANAGIDLYYSGTAAAAREAAALGCPAVAFSVLIRPEIDLDWKTMTDWTIHVLGLLEPEIRGEGPILWNVNFPALPPGSPPPPVRFVPMSTDPHPIAYEPHRTEEKSLSYKGPYYLREQRPGTDVEAVFSGFVSVTPLALDLTDWNRLDAALARTSEF